jgi:hypothetical protein
LIHNDTARFFNQRDFTLWKLQVFCVQSDGKSRKDFVIETDMVLDTKLCKARTRDNPFKKRIRRTWQWVFDAFYDEVLSTSKLRTVLAVAVQIGNRFTQQVLCDGNSNNPGTQWPEVAIGVFLSGLAVKGALPA